MPGDASYMYILYAVIILCLEDKWLTCEHCIASLVAILSRMAKHAAEAFSDILRLEMVRFGVHVVIVEPGNFGAAIDGLNVSYYQE